MTCSHIDPSSTLSLKIVIRYKQNNRAESGIITAVKPCNIQILMAYF